MKKITAFIFIVLLMLVACSDDSSSKDDDLDNATNTVEDQENKVSEDNAENKDKAAKEDTGEESKSVDAIGSDAEQLLIKSAEAMAGLSSFRAKGQYIDDSTINGQNDRAETSLAIEMVLTESITTMHALSNTVTNTGTGGEMEMYLAEENMYIKSPDEAQWFSMATNTDSGEMYDMFTVLQADQLEEYITESNAFEVTDNGDHYVLSFTGNDEQYKSVVMGASIAVVSDVFKEHYENMKVSGTYNIMIDKETYYMVGYDLEYESTTTGEMGDMESYHKATYTLSDYNAYDEITVPEEIVEEAISIGN
ncbi:DUF6612 family protein [Virgibacillus byunsanensis]|uniref:DUF6612 family protein n=1 Tax=Virgibacillus byunsanensis TaxID=570945 RepID=A0ABW3LN53_9BACI